MGIFHNFTRGFIKEASRSLLYVLTGALASCLAFFIAIQFMAPALSQEAPQGPASGKKAKPEKGAAQGVMGNLKKAAREIKKQGQDFFSDGKGESGVIETPRGGSEEFPPETFEGQPPGVLAPPLLSSGDSNAEAAGAQAGEAQELSPQGHLLQILTKLLRADGNSDPPFPAAGQPKERYGAIPSAEVESYVTPFIYDSANRRDPFEDPTRIVEEMDIEGEAIVVSLPRTPPEEYNLREIKIKGLMWNPKPPKVLVELPNNGGFYTLIQGDKIGRNGVIYDIREDELVIVESITQGSGAEAVETTEMKILKVDRLRRRM